MTAQPDFDRVAHIYRWAEYLSLGPLLQQVRTFHLPALAGCHRALVLGDGDGRFLARLFAQNEGLQAVAVDTSAAMLGLLVKNCAASIRRSTSTLTTQHGSALQMQPPPHLDLVVTHFFLDCLTQVEVDQLTRTIGGAARAGTLWLVSDFGMPPSRMLRPFAALYIRLLYLAFGVLTGLRVTHLPDPALSLSSAGFARIARHERLCGLLYSEIWQRQ